MSPPTIETLKQQSLAFRPVLAELRRTLPVDFPWYPYDIMANVWHVADMLPDGLEHLFGPGKTIADIGAADGDLAFFLESLGNRCDIYDNPPTNMNGLRAAAALKAARHSDVGIHALDLDTQFQIDRTYDVVFFLGILYHLKYPFYVLEKLASVSTYLFLSTRVARHFQAGSPDVSGLPVAYLLGPTELNDDATNYWIFSEAGLRRLIDRAGWDILAFRTLGDTEASLPNENARDERAFAVLRSRKLTAP
ncbi:MAG: hypothetical protein NVSMB18_27460 [Acetobacteraceae bacterium]